jgi:hypothetical protein
VIPAGLGGTLTTDRVCRGCNERAGREIDWPLQNDWLVAQSRLLYGVESARKGASGKGRTGEMDAHVAGDPEAIVDIDRDFRPHPRSRINRSDSDVTISGGSEAEINRLAERVFRQLEAEGRTPGHPSVDRREFNSIEVGFKCDGVVWLRAMAKMILATLSLSLDDGWLDTAHAERLRHYMWAPNPVNDDGSEAATFPSQPKEVEELAASPPTHLITEAPAGRGRVGVGIGLFGDLYVRGVVAVDPPVPDTCWIITPGESPRAMPWHQLVDEMGLLYVKQHELEEEE